MGYDGRMQASVFVRTAGTHYVMYQVFYTSSKHSFNSLLEAENIRPYQQFYITVVASVLRTFVAIYKVYMSTCCMVI